MLAQIDVKTGKEQRKKRDSVIQVLSVGLVPFLPGLSRKLFGALDVPERGPSRYDRT